jgi:hypothetical protein
LMASSIRMLHHARIGPFVHLQEERAAAQADPVAR